MRWTHFLYPYQPNKKLKKNFKERSIRYDFLSRINYFSIQKHP